VEDFRGLTIYSNGLVRILESVVKIFPPVLDITKGPDRTTADLRGIWDTGASGTMITQLVVDELGLHPIGKTDVHHADGVTNSPVFLVDLQLPMNVVMQGLNVTLGKLPAGFDVLIGMDVITQGDFAITNVGGVTNMSFRVPSCERIDYVKDSREINEARQQRAQRISAKTAPPIHGHRANPKKKRRR